MNNPLEYYAKEVLNAYESGNELKMIGSAFELSKLIHRHPALFIRNDHPLIVFVALYRSLKIGGIHGAESLFTTYYCMLRSFLEKRDVEKIEAAMYGFLFLDSNMGLLQLILFEKIQNMETVRQILYQHLSLFYMIFQNKITSVVLDTSTSSLLTNRIKMYNDVVLFNLDESQFPLAELTMERFCNNIRKELQEKDIELEDRRSYEDLL